MLVRFLVFFLLLIGPIHCLYGGNTISVTDVKGLKALETMQNISCSIDKSLDLGGKTIRLPSNSLVRIKRGKLKNGVVVLDRVTLNCREGAFEDAVLQGNIKNRYFSSEWLKCTGAYSDLFSDAIKVACNSNIDFFFSEGIYLFKNPIYLYNNMSLVGKGKVILETEIESMDGKAMSFIIAGNDALNINGHVKGMKWEGRICGLSIVFSSSQKDAFDTVIGLYNASNCSVYNCCIDASACSVRVGHFIGAYNNARFANPSGGQNIHIYNNKIKCQGSLELEYDESGKKLSSESIGFGDRENVVVENNHIINASDDLGVHSCKNVVIRDNKIESLDGRIYISGTRGCDIENNNLYYISPVFSGMGIKVTVEHLFQAPNTDIRIHNNIVDYTKASNTPNYGIWVQGQNIEIVNNTLISNGASNARIWVDVIRIDDNLDKRLKNKGFLVPDKITIKNNKAKSLYCVADTRFEVSDWVISNNIIESNWFVCNRKEAVQKSNIVNGCEKK